MSADRSLIAPTSKPLLESALKEKLQRRAEATGSLGELEPLAIRLGLMQNTLKPRFRDPACTAPGTFPCVGLSSRKVQYM